MEHQVIEIYPTLIKPTLAKKCIIFLAGRGGSATNDFFWNYKSQLEKMKAENVLLVGAAAKDEYYPAPRGPKDQDEAIRGQGKAVGEVMNIVLAMEHDYEVKRENVWLCGFSAGAVMAVLTATTATKHFGGVIAHAGAILEPDNIPQSNGKMKTPFALFHNKDDNVFKWDERYLPMKKTLTTKGYNVTCFESEKGGHTITQDQIEQACSFIARPHGS
jgi:phospholipase/carboxylesterase